MVSQGRTTQPGAGAAFRGGGRRRTAYTESGKCMLNWLSQTRKTALRVPPEGGVSHLLSTRRGCAARYRAITPSTSV